MNIKNKLLPSTILLKRHVNRYTLLGLAIALGSIFIACLIVSYQLTRHFSIEGIVNAQTSNPAIWILDLSPFMFVYWGQAFCEGIVNQAQSILCDRTDEFLKISGSLELKLKYESYHDSLTKLPNNRMFSEQINSEMEQLGTEGLLAVIIVKINDFENISYNFGSFNANTVLKQFADKLQSILVQSYMLQSSLGISSVCRLQGEEFAFLLPRLKAEFNPDELLSALHQSMINDFIIDGLNIKVSATSGMAIYPTDGYEEGILLSHANIGLYNAKKQGLPYMLYNSGMEEDLTQNKDILSELKRAIESNQLDIYFQPIVALETGTIVGAESLVRFEHPQFGLLSADKFIPLIEGTSLIRKLTLFMLKGVIKQLASWHSAGYRIFASVNLSIQDVSDRELPPFIKKLLEDYKLAPEHLKLEFTERACLTDQSITKEVLEQLSSIGVKLSIDDFCSGYSSFIYLLNFPIDDIKIEKSYVLNMNKDPKKAKIVEAIIKLTETLKLEIVAEGIADEVTLEHLKKLGCSYGQGFHFSRAVDAAHFKALLKNQVTDHNKTSSKRRKSA